MKRSPNLASAVVLALLLAACAEAPQRPSPPPPPPEPVPDATVPRATARHRALAERYQREGDFVRATAQWQAVVLLDPSDARARASLADVRARAARVAADEVATGQAAQKAGDAERATAAYLRALAADPDNAEAAKQLRDLDRQRATRVQADRAARAGVANGMAVAPSPAPAATRTADPYDVEQRIEMFRAGDIDGGLREFRRLVDAHPNDRAARVQIATAVYDRCLELEAKGAREEALSLCEQAIKLRGERSRDWSLKVAELRRTLGNEYYDKGSAAWVKNPAQAVRYWETSLRFDPKNTKSAARLAEARKPAASSGGSR